MAGAVLAAALLYAWWATGVRPFTVSAYVLLALPVLLALALYARAGGLSAARTDVASYYERRSSHRFAAWIVVLVFAIALETVGLALGGRSTSVPTLSTTLDHLLVAHWGRWLLFVAWLWVAIRPIERLRRLARGDPP